MRVALFITCVNDALFPATGRATVALLERLGVEVDFPAGQTCCGQMQYNTGYRRQTEPLVRRFAEVFAGYEYVVTPSGSCAAMVRENYPRIGAAAAAEGHGSELADLAAELAPRVFELTEFLIDVLGVTDVGAYFPHTVTYHPTCHSLRLLGLGDRPLRLLRAVDGLELRELPGAEECCGFGGTFAVKNPAVSAAMGRRQGAARRRHRRRGAVRGRQLLPDAHRRHLVARRTGGPRAVHLAEILAATGGEEHPVSRTDLGMPSFPEAARESTRDEQLRAQPAARHPHHPRQARRRRRRTGRLAAAAGGRRGDQGPARCATSTTTCCRLEAAVTAAGGAGALGGGRRGGQPHRRPTWCGRPARREVVKVKSMATQEIGLNEALEAAGIAAYETDLAELIVQLGDDRPSHILVPAIHRNRGRDPRHLPGADGRLGPPRARRARPTTRPSSPRRPGCTCGRSSCAPRSAVSGANFLVAETGTAGGPGVRGQRPDVPDAAARR